MSIVIRVIGLCCFLAGLVSAAEWRLRTEWTSEGLVRFVTETNRTVAGPEQIVRWQTGTPRLLHSRDESFTLALNDEGLQATITKGSLGLFGELIFRVDLRNAGKQSVSGTLRPPFSQWADSPSSVAAPSPEFMLITAAQATIGTLGVHRSRHPGTEFDADIWKGRSGKCG